MTVNDVGLFPSYVTRPEEQEILDEAAHVKEDGQSRVVLLYGPGGTGKTRIVRQLFEAAEADDASYVWLEPIDVDDSQHWLLSNLERYVAAKLDPENEYFGPYESYLSKLPTYPGRRTSRETILSHLNRIKSVFAQCYQDYIEGTGKTVVLTFDTVEAIRGMYLVLTLAQWIEALPGTLFILAGRDAVDQREQDPFRAEIANSAREIPVRHIALGEFTPEDAQQYLGTSSISRLLTSTETAGLITLTQGLPLWLAFTIDYLNENDVPQEAGAVPAEISRKLPNGGDDARVTPAQIEDFKGHLVAPYQYADFWHEAIRRLAVVRHSISKPVWVRIMADCPRPDDMPDLEHAWDQLLAIEWVRQRANRNYVTLHDAVADELGRRVILLHDQDEKWRQDRWRQAAEIYAGLSGDLEALLTEQQEGLTGRLRAFDARSRRRDPHQDADAEDLALIGEVTEVDRQRQELHLLRSAQLFYQLLSDAEEGARLFLALLNEAREEHDVLFEDLLASEMQRFLPGGPDISSLGEVVSAAIYRFREWLQAEGRDLYTEIGLALADFLIDREQLGPAMALLERLPVPENDHYQRYRQCNLRANACMRTPGRVAEAGTYFDAALTEARLVSRPDRHRLIASAHKEQGFYYRNVGQWKRADAAYHAAHEFLSSWLSGDSTPEDREEMASIQTNWAYLKGIGGGYRDGINLVDSAITVRRRFHRRLEVAMSQSVRGEVFRYQRQFIDAWDSYADAERTFEEQNNLSWLGTIRQEQAICLFQAERERVPLPVPGSPKPEDLILDALNLCHDHNARAYPSALNRAGRIFGRDFARGLSYLKQAADSARELSDGWFLFASLIEYAELSYDAWLATQDPQYTENILTVSQELRGIPAELHFPELRGRWSVLQGHLGLRRFLETGDEQELRASLEHYKHGFPLISYGYVGSYGQAAVPQEFGKFSGLFWQLPPGIQAQWLLDLRASWREVGDASTLLLARLEELY